MFYLTEGNLIAKPKQNNLKLIFAKGSEAVHIVCIHTCTSFSALFFVKSHRPWRGWAVQLLCFPAPPHGRSAGIDEVVEHPHLSEWPNASTHSTHMASKSTRRDWKKWIEKRDGWGITSVMASGDIFVRWLLIGEDDACGWIRMLVGIE